MNGDFHVETAQERAEREGWLVVGTIPFELLRVAGGNPMAFKTEDGQNILIRLLTADEALAKHQEACETDGIVAPTMTRAMAEDLTRPLPI